MSEGKRDGETEGGGREGRELSLSVDECARVRAR